ncbi:MAG: hypothetical protein ISS13_01615 [Actinobacteria bacterium]|nr:hypothetical protein [Actinomycetota bacterium]MBL7060513.1 hypothetical protein [Actinomycetota bacterium]
MESINDSHREYIKIIRRLTPEEKLKKCFELNELTKKLFLTGLKNRFPNLSQEEIKKLYLKRINKCHNLDY